MMMFPLKVFWKCLFSPKLHKVYIDRNAAGKYVENNLERWGDQIISSIYLMWNLGLYTSPVIVCLLYRKGYFMYDGVLLSAKFALSVSCVLAFSYCLRSYGRVSNSVYLEFQKTLDLATRQFNNDTKRALSRYDFDFSAWPVEFSIADVEGAKGRKVQTSRKSFLGTLFTAPFSAITFIVAHTFGIRLIYPGSVSLVSYMISSSLISGRSKLIKHNSAERFKLRTTDANEIDTIFIDRRNKNTNGSTLVICSEGNAGFYEIGIMGTPIEANYSVLGWNHPGFGGSTGMPFPDQEQNAIDTVMQFAIHRLGFPVENIVLFGWSIGGYATSWAAMTYPEVKCVILDATFDDLLPLAIPRMPQSMEPIVRETVRQHCNLDVANQMCQYPGPVLLIRRSADEIICLVPGDVSSNRANPLLSQILRHRYPNLFTEESEDVLEQWLAASGNKQRQIMSIHTVDEPRCRVDLAAYHGSHDNRTFPSSLGGDYDSTRKTKMLLFLANEYMKDFNSTHCTQLPESSFQIPQLL
ncbi:phosphatidylserine lipase ABHD16A isoform X2 [Nilaparvata lugens]|uniref:phosphatidylserine lipase ABHD16A isoform X2 n=1 Tax=Nilaparvata lugens TaxID=108931 RepID=UPI00193CFDB5|nr:phosphatidylserine lipase ABHD16A isoform X2 [Nilaparvata lugens]